MDKQFWHDKWQQKKQGFHQNAPNEMLVKHLGALALAEDGRVFLPLCGKTNDIPWLLSKGLHVVGAELSEFAVEQLFEALAIRPEISIIGTVKCFCGPKIQIFAGDFFDVSREMLGVVDGIYDRAALVALPKEMRRRYAQHLVDISANATQLLVSFVYEQTQMNGPPFSVDGAEIHHFYGQNYSVTKIDSKPISLGVMSELIVREEAWLLE